ncbi:MAG: hypothetical protein WD491_08615 [Balneolales bacterium]
MKVFAFLKLIIQEASLLLREWKTIFKQYALNKKSKVKGFVQILKVSTLPKTATPIVLV